MARPPKDDLSRRSKSLRLRLTPTEHAWLKVLSENTGKNMRQILWESLQEKLRAMDIEELSELTFKVVEETKNERRS